MARRQAAWIGVQDSARKGGVKKRPNRRAHNAMPAYEDDDNDDGDDYGDDVGDNPLA